MKTSSTTLQQQQPQHTPTPTPTTVSNQEEEEHTLVLSSLKALVQHETSSLAKALDLAKKRAHKLERAKQSLQQEHTETALQLQTLQQVQHETLHNLEQLARQSQHDAQEHNRMLAQASNEMTTYRRTMEDRQVETEETVHQKVALIVEQTLQTAQDQHEETIASLHAAHATLISQHQDSLATFETCKSTFQTDIAFLKTLYDAKIKTKDIKHESDLLQLMKDHKQTLMEQSSTHHHAVNLQEQMHGTTMMVHHTTLEAKVRAQLTAAEQERNHYKGQSESFEKEKLGLEKQLASNALKHIHVLKNVQHQHEEALQLVEEQRLGELRDREEEHDHVATIGRLKQSRQRLTHEVNTIQNLLTKERKEQVLAMNENAVRLDQQSKEWTTKKNKALEEGEQRHARDLERMRVKHCALVSCLSFLFFNRILLNMYTDKNFFLQ